jgi:hypothetical protein
MPALEADPHGPQYCLKVCPCIRWRACHHWVSAADFTAPVDAVISGAVARRFFRCGLFQRTGSSGQFTQGHPGWPLPPRRLLPAAALDQLDCNGKSIKGSAIETDEATSILLPGHGLRPGSRRGAGSAQLRHPCFQRAGGAGMAPILDTAPHHGRPAQRF